MFETMSKSKSQTQSNNKSKDKSNATNNSKSVPIQTKSLFSPLAAQLKPISENNELTPTPKTNEAQENLRPKVNNTGIPTPMKNRFENLSGFSFDDVKVHYNSDKPTQLQALAYTRGNQVYVAPGQEKHLGHELGHVVQQKQGIVKPTEYIERMAVNTDRTLESLATILSEKNVKNVEPIIQFDSMKTNGVIQMALPPGQEEKWQRAKNRGIEFEEAFKTRVVEMAGIEGASELVKGWKTLLDFKLAYIRFMGGSRDGFVNAIVTAGAEEKAAVSIDVDGRTFYIEDNGGGYVTLDSARDFPAYSGGLSRSNVTNALIYLGGEDNGTDLKLVGLTVAAFVAETYRNPAAFLTNFIAVSGKGKDENLIGGGEGKFSMTYGGSYAGQQVADVAKKADLKLHESHYPLYRQLNEKGRQAQRELDDGLMNSALNYSWGNDEISKELDEG